MTDVALREYLERIIEANDRRYMERFAQNDVALKKAADDLGARLAGMNEFREALKEQANQMATRNELQAVNEIVHELRRARANLDGRLAIIATVVSIVVSAAITLWLRG